MGQFIVSALLNTCQSAKRVSFFDGLAYCLTILSYSSNYALLLYQNQEPVLFFTISLYFLSLRYWGYTTLLIQGNFSWIPNTVAVKPAQCAMANYFIWFLSTLTKLTEKNTALLFKGGVGMYGGGAENRTPVQSKSAAGVSKLSCSLHLKQRTPSNLRLLFQPVQSFCKAYRLRPYKHLPKMTSPRKREHIPV